MRIRTVKPEFWENEDLAGISMGAQLLAVGLLNLSDDEGYFKSNPKIVQAAIFPIRDSVNVHTYLTELSNIGYIHLGEGLDGKEYGRVVKFCEHQRVNRPTPSKIRPIFKENGNSLRAHGGLTEGSSPERKGREGKGREEEGGKPPAVKGNKFKKPELDELKSHIREKGYSFDPESFMAFYESKGWKVGSSPMKSWKAACVTWHKRIEKDKPARSKI